MDITYNLCSGCEKKEDCEIRKKYSKYMRTNPVICDVYKKTGDLCRMCYWWSIDVCIQRNPLDSLFNTRKTRSKCDLFRLRNGIDPDKEE